MNADPNDFQNSYPEFLRHLDTEWGRAEFGARALQRMAIYRSVRSIANAQDREDVISSVIVACFINGERVLRAYKDLGRPFESYFRTIVRTKIYDFYRGRRKGSKLDFLLPEQLSALLDAAQVGSDLPPDAEVIQIVREEVERLEEPDRTLIVRRFFEGMTPLQIQEVMPDLSNKAIADRIRYAMQKTLGPAICRALKGKGWL